MTKILDGQGLRIFTKDVKKVKLILKPDFTSYMAYPLDNKQIT